MLKTAPAVLTGDSKVSLQARSSMSSASAPVWECSEAPSSGYVTGLGFCRLLGAIKPGFDWLRVGRLFSCVKKRLPPVRVGLGWTRAGANKYKSASGRLEAPPARGQV